MITKNELKYYCSLSQKKYRTIEKKFLVEGEKLIFEALSSNYECEVVFLVKSEQSKFNSSPIISTNKIKRIETVSEREIKKLQTTINPQGTVGIFKMKKPESIPKLNTELIVALENVNDPGNVGALIRNADWFGIKEIILSGGCSEIYNPKTIRASAGAVFHLNLFSDFDLEQILKYLKNKGYKILCADISGKSIYEHEKFRKQIIVFSNEANGPSKEILKLCDERLTVPKKGKAESLNVASASAVILSELTK